MTGPTPMANVTRRQAPVMVAFGVMAILFAIAPLVGIYPAFLMKALCFAFAGSGSALK